MQQDVKRQTLDAGYLMAVQAKEALVAQTKPHPCIVCAEGIALEEA
jgi:hypothetical protein